MEATVGDTISLNGALEPELEIAGRMRSLASCARAGKAGQRERGKASADVRLDRDGCPRTPTMVIPLTLRERTSASFPSRCPSLLGSV